MSRLVRAACTDESDDASLQTVSSMWSSMQPQLKTVMIETLGVENMERPKSSQLKTTNLSSPTSSSSSFLSSVSSPDNLEILTKAVQSFQEQLTNPEVRKMMAKNDGYM